MLSSATRMRRFLTCMPRVIASAATATVSAPATVAQTMGARMPEKPSHTPIGR